MIKLTKEFGAFCYKFTNTKNGMKYLGYHTGSQDDDYVTSSTNNEFWCDYQHNRDDFIKEIIEVGTTDQMKEHEHYLLKKVDARNNPEYYNKSNGGIYKKLETDLDIALTEQIASDIDNGMFECTLMPLKFLQTIDARQIRVSGLNQEKVDAITDHLNNSPQDYLETYLKPLIVVNINGRYVLLDGNHTLASLLASKYHSHYVIVIPYERLNYSEMNLTQLSLRMNKVEDVSEGNDTATVRETLKGYVEKGIDISDPTFKAQFGESVSRSPQSIGGLVRTVLEDQESGDAHLGPFNGYTNKERLSFLSRLKMNNPETSYSSAPADRIFESGGGRVMVQMLKENTKRGVILAHHTKHNSYERFKCDEQLEAIAELSKKYGLDITVKFLDNK